MIKDTIDYDEAVRIVEDEILQIKERTILEETTEKVYY